jgi:DNA-binding MarR family transcriptional regulator
VVDRVQDHAVPRPAPEPGLDTALGLVQLSGLVQAAFAHVAEHHQLSPLQGRLLCVLAEAPRGMAELARVFNVEKATITGLVDRAERRGLVERAPVPGDRRAVSVTLTQDGVRSAAEFHAEVTDQLKRLLAPLTPEDREQFRSAMATIAQSAGLTASWGGCRTC